MATTVQKIMYDARAAIDELTEDGILKAQDEVADINAKGIRFVDMAQKELFDNGNFYNSHQIENTPYVNALGVGYGLDLLEYLGVPQFHPADGGVVAKAYHFTAYSDFAVNVYEFEGGAWTLLTQISEVIAKKTSYKGKLTPTTTGNLIKMEFIGATAYRYKNIALWNIPFKTVPDYGEWIKQELPSNFRTLDVIIEENSKKQYNRVPNYKWENFKDLYINYNFEGELRVNYKPVPTTITSLEQVLEIDDITCNAITFYVAAKLSPFLNKSLVNYFEGLYNESKANSNKKQPAAEESIVDVYNGGNYGYN